MFSNSGIQTFFCTTKRSGLTSKSACLLFSLSYNLLVAHLLPFTVIITRIEALSAMSSSNVASGTQGRTSAQHHASVPGHEPDVATIFRNVNKRARKDQHGRPTSWQSEQSRVASSPSKTAPPNDASRHRVYPRQNQGQCQSTPSQAQVSTLNVNRRPTTDMPQGQTHSQPPPFQHPQPQQSLPRSLESVKQSMDPQQPRPVRTVPRKPKRSPLGRSRMLEGR